MQAVFALCVCVCVCVCVCLLRSVDWTLLFFCTHLFNSFVLLFTKPHYKTVFDLTHK